MTKREKESLAIEKVWQGEYRTEEEILLLKEWEVNGMFRNAMQYVLNMGNYHIIRELLSKSTGNREPAQWRESALSYGITHPTEEERSREVFWRKRFLFELRQNQMFLFIVMSMVKDSGAYYPEEVLERWVRPDCKI